MEIPEIFLNRDAIHVDKENGTAVDYFIFPEFEIHRNCISPTVCRNGIFIPKSKRSFW